MGFRLWVGLAGVMVAVASVGSRAAMVGMVGMLGLIALVGSPKSSYAAGSASPANSMSSTGSSSSTRSTSSTSSNEPLNAGALVDQIFVHCQRGQRGAALQVYRQLQAQASGALPAGIEALLQEVFQLHCQGAGAQALDSPKGNATGADSNEARASSLKASLSSGWASNVNAAPRPSGLFLNSGDGAEFFRFAPSSRPLSSGFVEAGFSHRWPTGSSGAALEAGFKPSLVQLTSSLRHYATASDFDTAFLGGTALWPVSSTAMVQLRAGLWQLGGQPYEWNLGLGYVQEASEELLGLEGGFWSLDFEQTRLLEASHYNADRFEALVGAQWQGPQAGLPRGLALAWAFGPSIEKALGPRPGGDRWGLKARLALQAKNGLGVFQSSLLLSQTYDTDSYSEALFGPVKRRRDAVEFRVVQDFKPIKELTPFLSLSLLSSKDRLPLFTYEAFQVQLGASRLWE